MDFDADVQPQTLQGWIERQRAMARAARARAHAQVDAVCDAVEAQQRAGLEMLRRDFSDAALH